MKRQKIGFIISMVLTTLVFGSALAPATMAAYAWNGECQDDKYNHNCGDDNQCEHHKYDHICDNTKKDITCNILVPSSNLLLHIGNQKHTSVSFTIQASDPVDGIKSVQVHMTSDNTHNKNAVLGGDGFYHVTWNTLNKGTHSVKVTCSDFAQNKAHDSVKVQIKK